jgi:hypothetical protein
MTTTDGAQFQKQAGPFCVFCGQYGVHAERCASGHAGDMRGDRETQVKLDPMPSRYTGLWREPASANLEAVARAMRDAASRFVYSDAEWERFKNGSPATYQTELLRAEVAAKLLGGHAADSVTISRGDLDALVRSERAADQRVEQLEGANRDLRAAVLERDHIIDALHAELAAWRPAPPVTQSLADDAVERDNVLVPMRPAKPPIPDEEPRRVHKPFPTAVLGFGWTPIA